jgi:CubicO group peptidase (beta-lactamase class C family)
LQALESGVASGVAPGFVAGVWDARTPDRFRVAAAGMRRPRLDTAGLSLPELPMTVETIFDLASLTKVYATATLTALLVDRGWLSWTTPVAAIFPQIQNKKVEVRHLLSHTAGYPAWAPLWERVRDHFAPIPLEEIPIAERQHAMRELVFAAQPEVGVGERALYSDFSFLLLGFVLEEVVRAPLDRAVERYVWGPMGIKRSFYRRTVKNPASRLEQVAVTELSPWHQTVLQGQVHDENCWSMGGYAGHAGAFGPVEDLMIFSRALFDGFLSREVLRAMWTRVSQPPGCSRTLGWDTVSGEGSSAGKYFSPDAVGHLGFTGTSLWIDPRAGLAVALLSNRVHPTRDNIAIRTFRPLFHNSVREDLLES